MATTLLDPQAIDLMLARAAVVNAEPRLRAAHLMPGHVGLSTCGWPQMTEQDRGAHGAKRLDATTTVQGARIADIGATYVTPEFSTHLGPPPSCSSPA